MVWDIDKKILFIHIPKTGGTTIENNMETMNKPIFKGGYGVLRKVVYQHFDYKDYIKFFGIDSFNEFKKFSIVRNPYSRIISEYYWTPSLTDLGYKSGKSFDYFLDQVYDIVKNKKYNLTIYHNHFIPQYEFICDIDRKIMVDKLFKFEEYDKVLDFLKKKKYNIDFNKKLNACEKGRKIKLNTDQKKKIYSIYKKDFAIFEYKK